MIGKVFKRLVLVIVVLLILPEISSAQGLLHQTVNSGGGTVANQAGYLSVSLGGAVDASFQNSLNQGFQQGEQQTIDVTVDIEVLTEEGQAPFTNLDFFRITITNVSSLTATNINLDINLELSEGASSNLNSLNLVIPQLSSGQTSALVLTIDANENVVGQLNNVHLAVEVTGANETLDNIEDDIKEAYASILNCKTTGISIDYVQSSGCAGEAISFTANETTFDSYQWFVDGELIGSNRTISYAPLSSETIEVLGTIAACSVSAVAAITISNYEFNVVGDNQVCPNSSVELAVDANHTDAGTYSWTYEGNSGTLLSTQGQLAGVSFNNDIAAGEKVIVQYTSSEGCLFSKEHYFQLSDFCEEGNLHQTVNSGGTTFTNTSAMLTISIGGAVNAYFNSSSTTINQGFLIAEWECENPYSMHTSSITESSAELKWSGDPNKEYLIRYNYTINNTWFHKKIRGNSVTINGLLTASNYRWQILTICDGEYYPSTFSAAPQILFTTAGEACPVPSNLNTVVTANNQTTFSWSAIEGVMSYRLKYNNTINNSWTYITTSNNQLTLSGNKFAPNAVYRWSVGSICSNNVSDQSYRVFYSTNSGTGVREGSFVSEELNIDVMPNPFNDYLKIMINSEGTAHVQVQLIDVNGVVQFIESNFSGGQLAIDNELSSGIYYLRITDAEGQSEFHKIVKQ